MSRTGLVIPLFLSLALMALAAGCGSSEKAENAEGTTTTSSVPGHAGHRGDQQYGGVHAPPVVKASELAKYGDGPQVGDTWTASIGVNVCGRFLDPLPGVATNGLTPQPNGTIQLAPRTKAESGLALTLADYSMAVGLDLETGELSLPDTVTPSEIPVRDSNVPLAGQTFKDGADCGGTKANVVVWVYSAEAVETGKGLVTVVENPEDIPFPTDGMAMVITLSPESSLPTLPPSVVQTG
ncbi:MAG: hypothetical protein WBA45_13345 [Microthrixaceae bacterium]